ncbi:MAG: hypothetical protein V5789_04200 [Colwellia sp.]
MKRDLSVLLMILSGYSFLLGGCHQDNREQLNVSHLKDHLSIPDELYGGFPSFDVDATYVTVMGKKLNFYTSNSNDVLEKRSYAELPNDRPFMIYIDKRENWEVLDLLTDSALNKCSDYFYVAHKGNEERHDKYLQVNFKESNGGSSVLRLQLLSNGRLKYKYLDHSFSANSYKDEVLRAHLSGFRTNRSSAIFLSASDTVSAGNFLETYGGIEYYTGADVYLELKEAR